MNRINFYWEDAVNQHNEEKLLIKWLLFVANKEKFEIEKINYFFVNDNRILELNRKYLNHNYYTDIITFDDSFLNKLKGEIYICVPVVKINSEYFSEGKFINELNRNIIHGLLHLIGYNDSTDDEKIVMRSKEDFYLIELKKLISKI